MCRHDCEPACGRTAARLLVLWLVTVLLAACGGGGGSDDDDEATASAVAEAARFDLVLHAVGTGRIVSVPVGIDCGAGHDVCSATFASGASVKLTATAVDGNSFKGWSGSITGCDDTASCSVKLNDDVAVTATFQADAGIAQTLSVRLSGKGSVRSQAAGIRCGSDCSQKYAEGSKVALSATPAAGYRFSGWSGACSGEGSCNLTMTAARNVTAKFKALPDGQQPLNVAVFGSGSVQSSPDGIKCGGSCAELFDSGTHVTLSASAPTGSRFLGWGGACTGTTSCRVELDAVATVLATFEAVPVRLSVTKTGSGTVTSDPAGIQCGTVCKTTLGKGADTTLAATPAKGWVFDGWGGDCSSARGASCRLPMEASSSASARFVRVNFLVDVAVQGVGSVSAAGGLFECSVSCTQTFDTARALKLSAAAGPGYRFAGWTGACSGSGACSVTASSSAKTPKVGAIFVLSATSGDLNLGACEPSGKGHDYQVGGGSGQIASLDKVPWEALAAGDTVRIFYRAEPYRGKMLIAASGTAKAPVRVCGVKSASGKRPIIEGQDAVARRGLGYVAAALGNIQESRSIILVDRLSSQDWGSAYPSHVQIDGLELRGARPGNFFTNSFGKRQAYDDFGACLWIDRGHSVTIADNVIHDCTNGIFSRSTDDGDFAVTKSVHVLGNYLYGNGVVGDEHQHNTYLQSVGLIVEFNRYGPLRAGALGNAIKDRSVGAVIRYNRIEEGAHAIDLVEAEDFPVTALADPAYRKTFVYGNQIVKNGDTGSVVHYGGDHYGSEPGNSWGEPIYRKGTLYFFYNTVYVTGSSGSLFQLSTTEEKAQIWNNVFAFAGSVDYPSLRQGSEVGSAWTSGGVLSLGRNWINAGWDDSDPWHPVTGTVKGESKLVSGGGLPIDTRTLLPKAGSALVDAAQADPAAVAAYPVDFQLDSAFRKARRKVKGGAADLGALER